MHTIFPLKEGDLMPTPLAIAICEDFADDAAFLQQLIEQSGIAANCEWFVSGEALLQCFRPRQYDIIFMDIYMKQLNGIESVRRIRALDEQAVIAFTTTSDAHTLESYRLGVPKYIEKPVTMTAVQETLELALLKRKSRPSILLLIGGKYQTIPLDSILYLEQRNHVVQVNTSAGIYVTSQTVKLSDVEAQLPAPPFLRCHHSYIVNLHHVQSLDKKLHLFTIKNGDRAYIRRDDLKKVSEAYISYLFALTRGLVT